MTLAIWLGETLYLSLSTVFFRCSSRLDRMARLRTENSFTSITGIFLTVKFRVRSSQAWVFLEATLQFFGFPGRNAACIMNIGTMRGMIRNPLRALAAGSPANRSCLGPAPGCG